ncbi:MAG: AI-2E family transporter, partial [Chloroflexota bacterium]
PQIYFVREVLRNWKVIMTARKPATKSISRRSAPKVPAEEKATRRKRPAATILDEVVPMAAEAIPPLKPASPRWGATTKLVVALTFVAVVAALMIQFHTIVGPLLMAFIFSYLLHPVAGLISRALRVSWRAAVGTLFLLIIFLLLGLLTVGGVGLVNQIQGLIQALQINLDRLPTIIEDVAGWASRFGVDLSNINLSDVSDQLLSMGQGILSQMGSLLGTLAGSVASFLGWTLFVLLVSFFVLVESGGLREGILKVDLPGYSDDLRRLGRELARIWNAFLRGQIIIFAATVAIYFVFLSVFGVRYAIGLALGAGFARFVPYVGPAVNWTALALVTFFQAGRPFFADDPLYYTLVIFLIALFIDQIFDNIVSPRVMADALRVHPAAVLVAAIISASLLGVLGVVIAAPMLATLQLFGQYTFRKMLDLDPWPEPPRPLQAAAPKVSLLTRLRERLQSLAKPRRK